MPSTRYSEQHGVNPSIMRCFYCGEDFGVALCGRLPDDARAPHAAIFSMDPCPQCEAWMTQGIILISMRDGEGEKIDRDKKRWDAEQDRLSPTKRAKSGPFIPQPYRTGNLAVVTEDAIREMIANDELREQVLHCRWLLVEDAVWNMLGLPVEEEESEPKAEGVHVPEA